MNEQQIGKIFRGFLEENNFKSLSDELSDDAAFKLYEKIKDGWFKDNSELIEESKKLLKLSGKNEDYINNNFQRLAWSLYSFNFRGYKDKALASVNSSLDMINSIPASSTDHEVDGDSTMIFPLQDKDGEDKIVVVPFPDDYEVSGGKKEVGGETKDTFDSSKKVDDLVANNNENDSNVFCILDVQENRLKFATPNEFMQFILNTRNNYDTILSDSSLSDDEKRTTEERKKLMIDPLNAYFLHCLISYSSLCLKQAFTANAEDKKILDGKIENIVDIYREYFNDDSLADNLQGKYNEAIAKVSSLGKEASEQPIGEIVTLSDYEKEARARDMFDKLREHIDEDVIIRYLSPSSKKAYSVVCRLNGVNDYDGILIPNDNLSFISSNSAIIAIKLRNNSEVLYSNPSIKNIDRSGRFSSILGEVKKFFGERMVSERIISTLDSMLATIDAGNVGMYDISRFLECLDEISSFKNNIEDENMLKEINEKENVLRDRLTTLEKDILSKMSDDEKETHALAMFDKLREHIGEEVEITYWDCGCKEIETSVLSGVTDFDSINNDFLFISHDTAIINVKSNDGEILYSNPYIDSSFVGNDLNFYMMANMDIFGVRRVVYDILDEFELIESLDNQEFSLYFTYYSSFLDAVSSFKNNIEDEKMLKEINEKENVLRDRLATLENERSLNGNDSSTSDTDTIDKHESTVKDTDTAGKGNDSKADASLTTGYSNWTDDGLLAKVKSLSLKIDKARLAKSDNLNDLLSEALKVREEIEFRLSKKIIDKKGRHFSQKTKDKMKETADTIHKAKHFKLGAKREMYDELFDSDITSDITSSEEQDFVGHHFRR